MSRELWLERETSAVSLVPFTRRWKQLGDDKPSLFGSKPSHFTEDLELTLMQYLSATELAKLCATSKRLRRMALLVCAERLSHLMGLQQEDSCETPESSDGEVKDRFASFMSAVERIPLVEDFLQRENSSLARLLHMVTHSRQQTYRCTLSLGEAHTCAVVMISPSRSVVYSFGEGGKGQLGNGTNENSVVPHMISLDRFPGVTVASVACGANHTCLLTSDGRILSCGLNKAGQLGDGTRDDRNYPAFIKEYRNKHGDKVRYTQIVAGRFYTAALTTEGRVAVFGEGLDVELLGGFLLPRGDIAKGEKVVQLAAGQEHLLMLSDQNKVYAVGSGYQGKLGLVRNLEETPEDMALPPDERRFMRQMRLNSGTQVPRAVAVTDMEKKIVHIAAGGNHSAYVTADGGLYTWGSCVNGELGLGKFTRSVPVPTKVDLPAKAPFALHVSCGKAHTAVLTTSGNILTFGSGTHNQDGKRHKFWATNQPQEICLGELEHHKAALTIVVCGGRHSATQDVDGSLFCFGDPMCTGRPFRARDADSNFLPKLVAFNRDVSTGGLRCNSM